MKQKNHQKGRENKQEKLRFEPKTQKPKVGYKRAKEQIMFKNFHWSQETY